MTTDTRRARRERRSALPSERLGEQFHKRLASYAAAAGAAGVGILAMAQPATAKIVYVPLHEQIPGGFSYVSLDVDGAPVVTFFHATWTTFTGYGSLVRASGSGGGVEGPPLRKGTPIGPADQFFEAASLANRRQCRGCTSASNGVGAWVNVDQRYLGFEFKLNGQVHYGWARLSVRNGGGFTIIAVLNGYAYNTAAGQPIFAGQTSADPATQPGPEALVNRAAPQLVAEEALRPGSLGLLALGSLGLPYWRREDLSPR